MVNEQSVLTEPVVTHSQIITLITPVCRVLLVLGLRLVN